MSKYAAWTAAALVGSSALLSGCQSDAGAPGGSPAAVNASAPATIKSSNLSGLALESAEIVVSPGSAHRLTVFGVLKNGEKQEISGSPDLAYKSDLPEIKIDANGNLSVPSDMRTGTAAKVHVTYGSASQDCTVKIKYSPADTVTAVSGKQMVTNTSDLAVLVNKKRELPADYVPGDLVYPNVPFSFQEKSEKRMMRKEAAAALEKLFAQADKEKVKLFGVSAYRSYKTQTGIYTGNVKSQGQQQADQFSAKPGQSEHQTGLAIDVYSASAKPGLDASFGDTSEGKWLSARCADFGFILRYPKGKESITGYNYEPWHIRYVGTAIAEEITAKGWTFEEYFKDAAAVHKPAN